MSAVDLAELYDWVLRAYDEATAEAKEAEVMTRCLVLPLDAETAVRAARVKMKEKMAMADSIVLATGRALEATVITGDAALRGEAGRELHPPVVPRLASRLLPLRGAPRGPLSSLGSRGWPVPHVRVPIGVSCGQRFGRRSFPPP